MKLEKIYGDDGVLDGYKYGNHYLMKKWGWNDTYSWIINTDGANFYFDHVFWKQVELGNVEICLSFRHGKERLAELERRDQA